MVNLIPGEIYGDVYGLTGIMGSGKSTAARMFQEKGAAIIDADSLARKCLEPGYPGAVEVHAAIRKRFSEFDPGLYDEKMTLNRSILGRIVFSDPVKLKDLNAIVHPHVQNLFCIEKRKISPSQVIIYDVPLLFENGLNQYLKKSIVVYCSESTAIARAASRTRASQAEIKKRLAQQISIEEKKKLADHIIDNSSTLSHLAEQVEEIYLRMKNGEF